MFVLLTRSLLQPTGKLLPGFARPEEFVGRPEHPSDGFFPVCDEGAITGKSV
ncbi:hypothetical protein [Neolewinella persica]|uniref:hypothetical protein n=1 Tax=Neolewinella persica TaxID=70998 RepID=UPI0012FBD571|nr:hypothetical protein [Neolewinella persica]